jgi:signal transduction histidine kinase
MVRAIGNRGSGKSNKVEPMLTPVVVGHQTSFDKAMRERMAELVGNDHMAPNAKFKREAAQITLDTQHRDSNMSWWQFFYHSHGDNNMYDVFLNFKDEEFKSAEQRLNYLSFKNSDGNIPLQIFGLCFGLTYGATRFWWAVVVDDYATNPAALASVLMMFVCAWVLISILLLRLTLVSVTYDIPVLQRFHPAAVSFLQSRFGHGLDDSLVVGAALSIGLHVVSQAMADACPPGTTTLNMRDCNISAAGDVVAPEVMVLAIIGVLVCQMLARGVSRIGLVCAWSVMVATINASLWLVGSMSYLWINLELVCVIYLSYELERYPLRQFIKSVRMLEASEVNAQLQISLSKYQIREGELALEAKRSMVRHIGHEIRTPLNVIGVGTDVLLKELKQLKPRVPRAVLEIVEGIQDASGTALEVVNELMMFEKLAAGMTTIETAPTRIVRFLNKAMKHHTIPARAKEIDFTLTVDARDSQLGVNVDPVKMTIVFRNLFR